MRWLVALCACSCGRIALDPRPDASTDASLACESANLDLVGCWLFDPDARDGSAYHLDVTATGLAYRAGHTGNAGVFGASVQLLIAETPVLDLARNFTVELWIQRDREGGGMIFDNDNQYAIRTTDIGNASFTVVDDTGGSQTLTGATFLSLADWHHLALRHDGTAIALFVDGAQDVSSPSGPLTMVGSAGSRIGGDAGPLMELDFVGAIDEVRIWRVARSDAEICTSAGRC